MPRHLSCSSLLKNIVGVLTPYCKENNKVASKLGAQIILRSILGLPIDVDAIPSTEDSQPHAQNTIVEADPVRVVEGVEIELYAD